jgi:Fe-S-cluster-containing dehydrogenase component
MKVISFLEEAYFVPTVCLQCERPYCALICRVGALNKNPETGVVERDKNRCIGCKLCLIACPFGNLTFVNGVSAKCDLCNGNPTCVKVCNWGALSFEEADEIGAGKRVFVANRVYESEKEFEDKLVKVVWRQT